MGEKGAFWRIRENKREIDKRKEDFQVRMGNLPKGNPQVQSTLWNNIKNFEIIL